MEKMLRFLASLLLATLLSHQMSAQSATLSVQGILKKSNGVAVDDGTYSITFKLYTQETGGIAIWTENQSDVEVSSGIYSATLGTVNTLNVPFNQLYYLGVTIGSTELTPRILLTSAPYALSLIGQSNKFPSTGKVEADNIVVPPGAPASGVAGKGYSFATGGDEDGGLFSTANGQVGLYVNGAIRMDMQTNPSVQTIVHGPIATNDLTVNGAETVNGPLNIASNNSLQFNGNNDWRLVETDYFESGAEGWQVYAPVSGNEGAWRNGSGGGATVVNFGDFAGRVLSPTDNDNVFKKNFNLSGAGSYTHVKVVFNYYMIDTWDGGDENSFGWGAFANNASGTQLRVAWKANESFFTRGHWLDNDNARTATTFSGQTDKSDQWLTGSMVARYPSSTSTSFWVFFGYANDESVTSENFAVGSIEVWVK